MCNIDDLISLLESKPISVDKMRTEESMIEARLKRPNKPQSTPGSMGGFGRINRLGLNTEEVTEMPADEKVRLKMYNKQEIMEIFSCEDQKALKLMHVMHSMSYAVKLGREYYVREERLFEFVEEIKNVSE